MRQFFHRFPAVGGVLLFAVLCVAALAGPRSFQRTAATLTVTSTADSGAGSLRAALAAASDGDTIQFDPALNGQTISLSSGELEINKSITISGPGANLLAVSRSGASQFRIFHALSGHTVVVEGLTIAGGDVHNNLPGCGGGILNDGATSTINHCTISGNRGLDGGGICSDGGSLIIANSSVGSNQAGSGSSGGSGGGIYHRGGSLELVKSTVTNNTGINLGGGVMCAGGTITIIDSTIRGNTTLFGGGIAIGGIFGGTGDVRNSTVSGNTAQVGGGIGTSSGAALMISNSTVSGNFANIQGGGIYNNGAVEVENTILNSGANVYNSGGTVTSHGYNLCSDDGAGFLTGPGDQVNTDPLLGPLQDNGGPTFTHNLLPGSPAINAGDPNFAPPPQFDQRGPGYFRLFNGRIDIGSLEVQPPSVSQEVSLPIDTFDTSVPIDTVIIRPVLTTNIDASLNYVAFQGDFTYDERVVTFSEPFVENAGITAGKNWSLLGNPMPGPGPIRTFRVSVLSLDFTPLSGAGTLYNLRMLRVSGTPGNTCPLVWKPDPENFYFVDIDLNVHAPAQNNGLITITGTGTPPPSPAPSATPTATATATPTATAISGGTPTPGRLTVSLPIDTFDTSVPINTVIIEPVLVTNIDAGFNFIGFQGDFTFDERVVAFSAPFVENAGLTAGNNWNVTGHPLAGPGPIRTFRVSAFSADFTPLNGSGTLFNLRMLRVSGTPGNTSPLVWKPAPNNFDFIDGDLNTVVPEQNNGLITITGTETPTPTPASSATPTATATATPTATATATSGGTPGAPVVSLPISTFDTSVPIGTVIIQPVLTTNIDASLNYVGFQGDFTYDSTVVSFSSPFVQAAGLTAGGNWNIALGLLPGPGPIKTARLSAFSTDFIPLNGSGTLFNLRMRRVSSTAGNTSPLVWQPPPNNFVFIDGDLNSITPGQNNGLITITGTGTSTPSPAPSATPTATATATPTATATSGGTSTPGPLAVSLPIATLATSVPINTVIIKPVLTTNIDASLNYVGFQADFTFDERVVTFSAPFVENAGLTAGKDWTLVGHPMPGPGPIRTFRLSAFSRDFSSLSGFGTLFNLRMLRVSSTPGNTSPLVWQPDPSNFTFIDGDLNVHVPVQNNGLITITGAGTPTPSPPPSATPTATATATPTATPPRVKVSLPNDTLDTSVPIATVIFRPVLTTNIDASLNYIGFQGDFTFDQRVVTFPAPFVQAAGLTGGGNWNVLGNILPGPGPIRTFRISAFSLDFAPLSGSGTLFNLRMLRVSSAPGNTSPLVWAPPPSNFVFIDGDLNLHVPDQNNGLVTIGAGTPTPNPTPSIAPPTHFAVSAPNIVGQNAPFSFMVTAQDQFNNTVPDYAGTVHFTSTDGAAELPVNSILVGGIGVFQATLHTQAAGQTITATDTNIPSLTGTSNTILVLPFEPATHFAVSAPNIVGPGASFSFTVTAQDRFNHTVPDYAGIVHFTSTDSTAGLPVNTPLLGGTGTFQATLHMLGPQTITVTDTSPASLTGTSNVIVVLPFNPPTHFAVTAPVVVAQDASFSFTVTAQDQFNHTVPDYAGTVHFTSTDSTAELPVDSTLLGGTGTFSATLHVPGDQTITATDTSPASLTGTSNIIHVAVIDPPTPTIPSTATPTPTPGTPTPTPTLTPSPTPTPCAGTIIWSENFDALPAGTPGPCWTISTIDPDTAPNDAFCSDPAGVSSCVLELMDLPTLSSASAVLRLRNKFNLEFSGGVYWDGGVLEVSSANISGGDWLDITDSHIGGSFVTGGYTGEIDGTGGNPLAGRLAWSGDSGGYIDTVVNLGPNLVGQTFRMRLRFGSDGKGGAPGWRVDTVTITDGVCATPTPSPSPPPPATPSPSPALARSLNLSTRVLVQTGDSVGIGGFIITGSAPKRVILRGIGPSLTQLGVPNALADPVLELHGSAGFVTIVNDNWRDNQDELIIETGLAPTNDLESAILVTLAPGNYTAIVKGKNDTSGVGLVEIYDLAPVASQLANISTRAFVGTGGEAVIGGFILGPGENSHIDIFGLGPSLAGSGVNGVLADPTLQLRDSNGVFLGSNDNCDAVSSHPLDPAEACIEVSLPPGAYTVILAGKNGGTGIGLVEIYNLN